MTTNLGRRSYRHVSAHKASARCFFAPSLQPAAQTRQQHHEIIRFQTPSNPLKIPMENTKERNCLVHHEVKSKFQTLPSLPISKKHKQKYTTLTHPLKTSAHSSGLFQNTHTLSALSPSPIHSARPPPSLPAIHTKTARTCAALKRLRSRAL